MKRSMLFVALLFISAQLFSQNQTNNSSALNAAETLLNSDSKLSIGGYAQIDFNQPLSDGQRQNATLDVHRLVLLFGYRFGEKTSFVSEIELEHVQEVYVEQAFMNHEFLPWLNLRGGLMLVPMGIINEYHEPPTYNGVERPNLDSKIVPTTWREVGLGFTGRLDNASLKYQLYVMNGFNGYDGGGKFRGSDGFRKGRQKGAESFMSSPTLAARIDYYGLPGLKLGLSTYNGKSQSALYDGLADDDDAALAMADSSVVGINMLGFDARYRNGGFEARGQFNVANISNTDEYNELTGSDLGSQMLGWYLEAGYNVLHGNQSGQRLVPFVRYEQYNTHSKTDGNLAVNDKYNRTDVTVGAGWWLTTGTVLKADYQFFSNANDSNSGQFNLGIGIWF
ncbi:hypothetical protein [Maribellus sediminis]|uniref:hypothetical protein n=1 Tax=Maribellus sediminis TaxID=2696285 RepID=UPI0014305145|nr:hypothetical protein [Maribellus sediminis]